MTVKEMKERRIELGYTMAMLSEYSGVSLGTLQKIFNGVTKAPRYETVQALEAVLKKNPQELLLRETSAYQAKAKHTIADYDALPDEQRVELIDGEYFEMTAPRTIHQSVLYRISYQVMSYIEKNHGSCQPLFAPVDVQLDGEDENTIVQPDFMIICDKTKVTEKRVIGAPDFIIEILSPSTREKDMFIKANKYLQTGVREYWIVDTDKEKVIIYFYEDGCIPTIVGFDDPVPVRIYEGKLKIQL